jgi:hypothetical protein
MATTCVSWHSLLERLTAVADGWGVWKNADCVGSAAGDVDSIASVEEWPTIAAEFNRWAAEEGCQAVVSCTHAPGMLVLVAVEGSDPRRLIQLDVVARRVFRGGTLFQAADLTPLLRLDTRGFRRLAPGAEGLIRSIMDRSDDGAAELIERDFRGATEAAAVLGTLGSLALDPGRWARLLLELGAASRALREPRVLGASLWFDRTWRGRCPVFRALAQERRIDGDPARWISDVKRSHRVDELP